LYIIEDSNAIEFVLPSEYVEGWGERVSNKYPNLDIQFIGGNAMEQYIIGVTFAATGR